ncbi:MAG: AB hydrolase superfamily protein YdjP [Alphaproteobacteria bacterium MarineAlpha4_Bin2]|nr:MAG: AB hydrolase superfamily protein YdjP [Alphaproteobacteria bacterium MarineAlpha4_Bin2]|tara:strand:+ start:1142 stop:1897 length:756 start_codon:yes stop_codon:yes gene_type:complete
MPYLDRGDAKLYYEDDGEGLPIVLTHGFVASTGMWDGQVAAFKDHYRLIRWDMRGHGRTECPDDPSAYGQDITVADMLAIIDHLGIDKAVIAGHSLGGFISMRFNVFHPNRVQALILQGCGPGYRSEEPRAQWNQRVSGRAKIILKDGYEALNGASEVPASLQRSNKELAMAANGILAQIDAKVIDSLTTIAVPTLVIIGEGDTYYLQGSNYMANRIPGADHVVVPDAGHGVNIDKPVIVNGAFEKFLRKL